MVLLGSSAESNRFKDLVLEALQQGQTADVYIIADAKSAIEHFKRYGPSADDGVDITYIDTAACFYEETWKAIAERLTGGRSIILLGPAADVLAPLFMKTGLNVFKSEEVPFPGRWYSFLKADSLAN